MKVDYQQYGDSSINTLILLHPGGILHSIWLPFIEHWSDRYQIIAFDIYPNTRAESSSLEATAIVIQNMLQKLNIQQFHLIGSSLGANIALHLALLMPDSIQTLILDSAQAGSEKPPIAIKTVLNMIDLIMRLIPASMIERFMLNQFQHLRDEDQAPVRDELRRIGKLAFVQHAKASLNHNIRDRLQDIHSPTLIIAGENDMLSKSGEDKILASGIVGSRLERIPNAGHVTFLTQAVQFLSLVDQFTTDP